MKLSEVVRAINWNRTDSYEAPENVPVLTKIDDGQGERNVQVLTRKGRLWYGGEMYVYYTPTHWAYDKQL